MKTINLILAGSCIFIAGCTANGPAFSPIETFDANSVLVYVYRPFDAVGCGLTPHVYVDGVEYGPLKNKGYLVCFVEPGKRVIDLRDFMWDEPMTIYPDFIAGKEYYIRLTFSSALTSSRIEFGVIPKEYAMREIIYTKKAEQENLAQN